MELDVQVDDVSVLARLTRFPQAVGKAVARGAVRVGLELLKHVKTNELSGQALDVRTGNARRAAFYRVEVHGDDITIIVGEDLNKAKYMRAQEFGAVLHARASANLAIPIGEATTRKGVARFSARDVIANPGGFGYVGTFVHNRVIFGKRESGRAEALFVLKPQVVMRPVGYLAHTLNEKKTYAINELNSAVVKAWHDAE